jgi:hemerythrin
MEGMMCERFIHYKLGHPKMDAEHEKLMDLVKEASAASRDMNLDALSKALFAIQIDLEFHFAHEELIMEEVHYPYFDYHKQVHQEVKKDLSTALTHYKADKSEAHEKLVACLEQAIVNHIDSMDRQIVEFINKSQTGD